MAITLLSTRTAIGDEFGRSLVLPKPRHVLYRFLTSSYLFCYRNDLSVLVKGLIHTLQYNMYWSSCSFFCFSKWKLCQKISSSKQKYWKKFIYKLQVKKNLPALFYESKNDLENQMLSQNSLWRWCEIHNPLKISTNYWHSYNWIFISIKHSLNLSSD